jgi:hypothetical protein
LLLGEGEVRVLTTVNAVFNGSHTDPDTGVLHGHDYEIEAGWYATTERYEALQTKLRAYLAPFDHRPLPCWSAEELAPLLLLGFGCDWLRVARPSIGHSVTVER